MELGALERLEVDLGHDVDDLALDVALHELGQQLLPLDDGCAREREQRRHDGHADEARGHVAERLARRRR